MSHSPPTTGALYVYGIVRTEDAEGLDVTGIGDPPRTLRAITHGPLAALVSDAPPNIAECTREDVLAHARALETLVERVDVLPMRFGMTLADESAVTQEVLAGDRTRWETLLDELRGAVELTLKGFHDETAQLRRAVAANPEIGALRHSTALEDRLRLGELVAGALEQQRQTDASWLLGRLRPLARDVREAAPTLEGMVVNAAFLVDRDGVAAFDREVATLAGEAADGLRLRCLGPQPPYTFVTGES